MAADRGTWTRPRGEAWGNDAQRAVLHAIAEDAARRSGYKVVAIEALRSDGNLEFVAIAGDADARDELLGKASPLDLDRIVSFSTDLDGWKFIPGEAMDDDTREWLAGYGHIPDLPPSDLPDAWTGEDRLVQLLTNEDGELRGTLYLDEPRTGRRPTQRTMAAVNAEIAVLCEAVVSIVERELYGEQVRMVSQARAARQAVRPGLEIGEFLGELSGAMVAAMQVHTVDVLLAGAPAPALEPYRAFFEEHMRRVWLRHGHLVVEPTQTWGVTERSVATPEVLAEAMERRGVGSWLLVPIGMGEEYLGSMGLGRAPDEARWIDSEINAAKAVASDVATVVLEARLMQRERELNAEIRDISDYRRDMVLTLAHELRNPVSVLFSHLEMLAMDVPEASDGPIGESMDAMDRASRRIASMIEDLMALATVSDTDRSADIATVDLSALVRDTCEFLAPTASSGGVHLRTEVADGLVVVGEADGLQRMVANLVSNACKYTAAGGDVRVRLEPATRGSDGPAGVRLVCADSGIGIAESALEHVFTPFFRAPDPEARKRPGTGLGLAIMERVVKGHDGTIEVASVLGEGTTFTVWLPVGPPIDVP
ncbi:HAMP domain-containing histidine kinase [Nocardioides oleivorans]|uniref:histidine kinase n=1 Tax=Nocardioides oleivorans TaxID=273676 RepID=A0A4V1RL16_9ACTN|nr:HAMP domain-containing sensor histidine kinase [Nocardioides oleivorans]RYB94212.1 HAMP domain-containing histidine kinase [Nocardioides oleivorans]